MLRKNRDRKLSTPMIRDKCTANHWLWPLSFVNIPSADDAAGRAMMFVGNAKHAMSHIPKTHTKLSKRDEDEFSAIVAFIVICKCYDKC